MITSKNGYLNLSSKNGYFPHITEKHNDDRICEKCGALFCKVKDCGEWQAVSLQSMEIKKGICEFCLD